MFWSGTLGISLLLSLHPLSISYQYLWTIDFHHSNIQLYCSVQNYILTHLIFLVFSRICSTPNIDIDSKRFSLPNSLFLLVLVLVPSKVGRHMNYYYCWENLMYLNFLRKKNVISKIIKKSHGFHFILFSVFVVLSFSRLQQIHRLLCVMCVFSFDICFFLFFSRKKNNKVLINKGK